jgi:hypothetical protein
MRRLQLAPKDNAQTLMSGGNDRRERQSTKAEPNKTTLRNDGTGALATVSDGKVLNIVPSGLLIQ